MGLQTLNLDRDDLVADAAVQDEVGVFQIRATVGFADVEDRLFVPLRTQRNPIV